MEGLLRTLAHQAINAGNFEASTFEIICPRQWQSCLYDQIPIDWPIDDLKAVLAGVIALLAKCSNVIIFVDGLDEYGAGRKEREELVDYLLTVKQHSKVKMCLSSRPWNEFKDRLGSCPHFKLEDINKRDMEIFVEAELAGNPAFRELSEVAEDQVSELFEQLVIKSSGVFLWLRLVTRRLKTSAEAGTPLRKLKGILDEIPPDLDEFFAYMLERIDQHERVQASKIFQLAVNPDMDEMPDLMMLSFTDEQDLNFALLPALQAETFPEIKSRPVALRRRLDSHCMDLLICLPQKSDTASNPFASLQIDYLHRTVRDFLISPASLKVLLSNTIGPFDCSRYHCNAALAQIAFLSTPVKSQASPTPYQCGLYIALFSACMRYLWSPTVADGTIIRSTLESAVDKLKRFLGQRMQTKDPVFKETLDWRCRDLANPRTRGSPFASNSTILLFCSTYSRLQISKTCGYLLVAMFADLPELSRYYLKNFEDSEDAWVVFQAVLDRVGLRRGQLDLDLLAQLSQHGCAVTDIATATMIVGKYHDLIIKMKCSTESAAEVSRRLLKKLAGLVGSKIELRDYQNKLGGSIHRAYVEKSMAQDLMDILQNVSKGWVIINSKPGLRSPQTTANKKGQPPSDDPTAGQLIVTQAGMQSAATAKSKLPVRKRVFGSIS